MNNMKKSNFEFLPKFPQLFRAAPPHAVVCSIAFSFLLQP